MMSYDHVRNHGYCGHLVLSENEWRAWGKDMKNWKIDNKEHKS